MCHLRNEKTKQIARRVPNAPASRGRLSSASGTDSRLRNVAGSRRRSIQDAGAAQSIWGQNDTQQRLDHHFGCLIGWWFWMAVCCFFLVSWLILSFFPGTVPDDFSRGEKTLPETYMGPLKIKGWKMKFPFGMLYLEAWGSSKRFVSGLWMVTSYNPNISHL